MATKTSKKTSTKKTKSKEAVEKGRNEASEAKTPLKPRKPGRKPGCKKTGGRKKGTPNKNKLKFEDRLEAQGFYIAEEIVKLFGETTDLNAKLRIIELMARHCIAVPKPVDQEGSSKEKIQINYIKD
jgi:hypothetical protein